MNNPDEQKQEPVQEQVTKPRKTLPVAGPGCDQCDSSHATKKGWVHEEEWNGSGYWDYYCDDCHKKAVEAVRGGILEDWRDGEWHDMSCKCRVWGLLGVSECDCKE
jgi:hypothetical protein